jgi:hypothetical protein
LLTAAGSFWKYSSRVADVIDHRGRPTKAFGLVPRDDVTDH